MFTNKIGALTHFIIAFIIALSASQWAQAQNEQDNSAYFTYPTVTAINGNIIECSDGFNADLSQAELRRPVEVGDRLIAFGNFTPTDTFTTLITATSVDLIKMRDLEFDGVIQDISGNTITVLNQPLLIDAATIIEGGEKLTVGANVYAYVETTADGFHAQKLFILPNDNDRETGIIAFITAINGNQLTLSGDFFVNISDDNLTFLMNNNSGVGARVFVNLRKAPKGKQLKSPFVGIVSLELQMGGPLQEVDTQNNTITVLNKQIPLAPNAVILDAQLNQYHLADLNPAEIARVTVLLDKVNDSLTTSTVFIFKKGE